MSLRVSGFSFFYLLMGIYAFIYGSVLYLFDDLSVGYFYLYFSVFAVWMMLLALSLAVNFISIRLSEVILERVVFLFFIFNFTAVFLQYIQLMVHTSSINVFASSLGMSAGDYLVGVFSNSSVNMVVSSFFLVFFLLRHCLFKAFLALIIILLTGYMSGIFVFLLCYLLSSFRHGSIKRVLGVYLFVFVVIFSIYFLSEGNFYYVYNALFGSLSVLGKVVSYYQTLDYVSSSLPNFIFGAGPGNFSSRMAFVFSGQYVDWLPNSMVYVSDAFYENHLSIHENNLKNFNNSGGTANQPFSFYNTLVGEYGFLGFAFFVFCFYRQFLNRVASSSIVFFFLLMGYLSLDYWHEYFIVLPIIEFLMLTLSKFSSSEIQAAK